MGPQAEVGNPVGLEPGWVARVFSLLTLAPCPLVWAVRQPRFQTKRDVVENALGSKSQISSHIRTLATD